MPKIWESCIAQMILVNDPHYQGEIGFLLTMRVERNSGEPIGIAVMWLKSVEN